MQVGWKVAAVVVSGLVASLAAPANAGVYERARRMHDRLVGTPPSDAVLERMAQLLRDSNPVGAADVAMEDDAFYSSTLKTFITPWTNEAQTVFEPLNDYTATVIGIIRDGRNFKEILTGDVIYVGRTQQPRYSFNDNRHYEALEESGARLSDPNVLEARLQSELATNWLRPSEAAGVLTTRAAGKAFLSAGTNRRMWRFMAINYLCNDLEALQDNTLPVDRIRQDVTRSPGGDSEIFLNTCSGCHTGMDTFAGAFAYFEWVPDQNDDERGRVEYSRGVVQEKFLINANTFPFGYATIDDRWDNRWRTGANSVLGWRGPESWGFGPKSLGEEIASSEAFSRCQVQKVFEHVCFRPPSDGDEWREVENIRTDFEDNDYDMKLVFAEVAAYCTENE